jgi:hypothetical protein
MESLKVTKSESKPKPKASTSRASKSNSDYTQAYKAPKPPKIKTVKRAKRPAFIPSLDDFDPFDSYESPEPAYLFMEYQKSILDNGITLMGDYIPCDKQRFLRKIKDSKDLNYWLNTQNLLRPVQNPNMGALLTLGSICLSEYLETNNMINNENNVKEI